MADMERHTSPLLRQKFYEFCTWLYERFENATAAVHAKINIKIIVFIGFTGFLCLFRIRNLFPLKIFLHFSNFLLRVSVFFKEINQKILLFSIFFPNFSCWCPFFSLWFLPNSPPPPVYAVEWLLKFFSQDEQEVLRAVRVRLFSGLKDRDKTIKDLLTAFWAQEKRLSGSTFQRLVTVFTSFLTPELETSFLSTACHLLLDLCRRSPVFNKLRFPTALSDCEFFKQNIATSWKQRATMAPVSSSTFSSGTFSGSYGGAGRLGQRGAPIFTPTQAPGAPVSDTFASQASFSYSSEFSQSLMISLKNRGYASQGMPGKT